MVYSNPKFVLPYISNCMHTFNFLCIAFNSLNLMNIFSQLQSHLHSSLSCESNTVEPLKKGQDTLGAEVLSFVRRLSLSRRFTSFLA